MRFLKAVLLVAMFSSAFVCAQDTPGSGSVAALELRAQSGDIKAQVAIAKAFRDGAGVPQNDNKALEWFMKAAKAGDPEAQDAVALTYRLDHNFTESMKWYGLAAKQGDANAMFNIATHYYNGEGVAVGDVEAYAWFLLSKKAGSTRADDAIQRAEKDLSPGQLSDGQLLAADMLAEGKAVPRDTITALAAYDQAGRYGKPEVQLRIAKVFLNGWGVPEDPPKAENYCRKALELQKDYTPAILCLGYLYQSGRRGPEKEKEAISWYEKAFKFGNPVAAYGLGVAYATGKGTPQNLEKGFHYLVIAALSNIELAPPLAKQVEQKLSPDTARKIVKKANEEKKAKGIFNFGLLDKQFSYVLKVDRLP